MIKARRLPPTPGVVADAVEWVHPNAPDSIDDELAARLFQPFSAGDVRTGSGLGLAICQEIVQAVQGTIALTNRYDGGAIVQGLDAVVRLPGVLPDADSHASAGTGQSSA
jgi:two-component system sensor histidine kinase TctE